MGGRWWRCVFGKCNCRLLDALNNGGLKVVMGCEWWRRVIGECNCRLLDALKRWSQGGHGLRVVVLC